MFKRSWFRRNRVYSDDGFSVEVAGRFAILYREQNRTMSIMAEMTSDGFVINPNSIGRWEEDPLGLAVGDEKRNEIVANLKRALESQGERIVVGEC